MLLNGSISGAKKTIQNFPGLFGSVFRKKATCTERLSLE
jgi:hypothetical protein